ncbi:hypothetical protein D3C76_976640 [compost metagenome]
MLVIEAQIHCAVGVQAQAAAVGQLEVLTLAASGVQVGQQRIPQLTPGAQPHTAAEQAQTCDHAQGVAARTMRLQEHLPGFAGLTGQTPIQRANRVERTAQTFLQRCPGLAVRTIHRQPRVEAFQQCRIGCAGAKPDHPVDGLLTDGIQARLAHGDTSLR